MICFQADADLGFRIVRAIRRFEPAIDIRSAMDAGLRGLPDSEVLDVAASLGRVLISHDRRSMADHFRAHLNAGKSSPGVFLVSQFAAIGSVVEAVTIVWAVSDAGEWCNQMVHLPSMSSHYFSGNKSR